MAQVTLPYTLTPGTPENVNNLMSNLTALRDGVNTIDTAQIANGAVTAVKLASGVGGMSLIDSQTFTSSTTYAISASAKVIVVECVGAGGGGGSSRIAGSGAATSGGAGGGYFREVLTGSEASGTVTVTIGAGGTGGAACTTNNTANSGGNAGSCRFGPSYFPGGLGGRQASVGGYVSADAIGAPPSFGSLGITGGQGSYIYTGAAEAAGGKGYRGGGGGGRGGNGPGLAGGSVESDPSAFSAPFQTDYNSSIFGFFVPNMAVGGGGAGGTSAANGTTPTTAGYGGGGGAGTGKNGGNGAAPGGGGGGAGTGAGANSGTGGNGAAGQIKVWVYG